MQEVNSQRQSVRQLELATAQCVARSKQSYLQVHASALQYINPSCMSYVLSVQACRHNACVHACTSQLFATALLFPVYLYTGQPASQSYYIVPHTSAPHINSPHTIPAAWQLANLSVASYHLFLSQRPLQGA